MSIKDKTWETRLKGRILKSVRARAPCLRGRKEFTMGAQKRGLGRRGNVF